MKSTTNQNNESMEALLDIALSEETAVWAKQIPDLEDFIHRVISLTLDMADLPDGLYGHTIECSVTLTDDAAVQILNRDYRDKDKPTNVLSFASLDADTPIFDGVPVLIGDIFMAYETVEREAQEQNKSFSDHFTHLIVHGTLHLLGYDHIEDDEAEDMESLEIVILSRLGIENPYIDDFSMA